LDNKEIKKSMRKRKRLYNIARKKNTSKDWDAYRKLKNSINSRLKIAHNNYYKKNYLTTLSVQTADNFGNTLGLSEKIIATFQH